VCERSAHRLQASLSSPPSQRHRSVAPEPPDRAWLGGLILVGKQQRLPSLAHVPLHIVGEHAKEDVWAHAVLRPMVDRPDLEPVRRSSEPCSCARHRRAARLLWVDRRPARLHEANARPLTKWPARRCRALFVPVRVSSGPTSLPLVLPRSHSAPRGPLALWDQQFGMMAVAELIAGGALRLGLDDAVND
jgi:hypothetical protein